jgi:predicted metalloendopeptidase
MDQTVIPSDKKGVYRQITPMNDSVDVKLNSILEAYAKGDFTTPSTYAVKLADFYSSCMNADQTQVYAKNLVKQMIFQVKKSRSSEDLAELVAKLKLAGISALFNFYSMQDYNDSTHVLGDVAQGGMGLENPAYYLDQDAKSVEIRQKYVSYISKLFQLSGYKQVSSDKIAALVFKFETALASKAYSVTDQGDPDKVNHVMSVEALKKLAPNFSWNTYFGKVQLSTRDLNVDELEFMANVNSLLQTTPKNIRDYYLMWLILNGTASEVGGDFTKAHFDFWNVYMNGTKTMSPRWQVCTRATEDKLGYALAEAYLKTFDGGQIKEKTNSMIDQIKEIFVEDLTALSTGVDAWIDGNTVKEAIVKAQAIRRKVGAPEVFRDYSSLQISKDTYLQNNLNIARFESQRDIKKIGQPVDNSDWGMMPWEVNAYYDRSNNEFVFPFGILMPPSLDLTASDGANFGAFGGGTIGHELTHGFDNNGSKYDSHGNLKDWWSEETSKLFDEKAKCYIEQANNYKIESVGLNVNGAQTLEENLSDQGGVKLGYMALDKILKTRAEGPLWNGKYSERQQYWLAYAQSWCSKHTPESLRSQMTNDVHPPSEFRVNAVVMNRPEFARDFRCQAGAKMAPVNHCSLW